MRKIATALTLAIGCSFALAKAADTLPVQKEDQALHDRLPATIKTAGVLVEADNGSFPPYTIVYGPNSLDGASADISNALGEVLGIKIKHVTVSSLSGLLTGINSGRYQLSIGPIGDYPDRENKIDFIDFVKEYVVFGVPKGNPGGIHGLNDTCGKRIAVMAGGSAEQVINKQSASCKASGKPAVIVQSFSDQPSSILAVRSGRSDAFFSSQAPLTYFVDQSHGELELAGKGQSNGFGDIFQGTVTPKDSILSGVMLDAYKVLFKNGTYAAIMHKWKLDGNILPAPGINLAKGESK